ncbi:ATP adenylyltransferase-domain-containing protein [Mucidula mucida]|nr:ATP adenylyltransferase-domain-containing protein [Mucidula mucida]
MLPHEIITKIPSQFNAGLESGELLFFPSTVHHHTEDGFQYEIRLCPALQKKTPFAEKPVDTTDHLPDPFNPPYNPNLFVGYLRTADSEEEYVILMNKYSVVRDHFLIVTKEFKSQNLPLMPDDLVSAYSLIAAGDRDRQNMFAFYNCGNLSGASQPHKHIQIIRIDDNDGPPVEKLARSVRLETPDKPFSLTSLPYANHVYRLPRRFSSLPTADIEDELAKAFISLLDLAISTIRHAADYPPGKPSYNFILTLEHMYIIPRSEEWYMLPTGDKLSVNSLGFAGMLLVKSDAEMEAVKAEGVGKILRGVGLESVHDLQVAGTALEVDDTDPGTHL